MDCLKVHELIERLEKMPKDAYIIIQGHGLEIKEDDMVDQLSPRYVFQYSRIEEEHPFNDETDFVIIDAMLEADMYPIDVPANICRHCSRIHRDGDEIIEEHNKIYKDKMLFNYGINV